MKDGKCTEGVRVLENRVRDKEQARLVGILVVEMIDQLRCITKFSS